MVPGLITDQVGALRREDNWGQTTISWLEAGARPEAENVLFPRLSLLLATRDLWLVGVNEERLGVAGNGTFIDHHLLHVGRI